MTLPGITPKTDISYTTRHVATMMVAT